MQSLAIMQDRLLSSKEFIAEMDARVTKYEADRATGISPEESKRRVQQILDKHRACKYTKD